MSVYTVASQFVELCNPGRNFDVMRTTYSPDIVSVEGSGEETAGQAPVIEKSERWVAINSIESQAIRSPWVNGAGRRARWARPARTETRRFALPAVWTSRLSSRRRAAASR